MTVPEGGESSKGSAKRSSKNTSPELGDAKVTSPLAASRGKGLMQRHSIGSRAGCQLPKRDLLRAFHGYNRKWIYLKNMKGAQVWLAVERKGVKELIDKKATENDTRMKSRRGSKEGPMETAQQARAQATPRWSQ